MTGPIDCRIGLTAINEIATAKPIEWFESNLISRVPARHAGGGCRVNPAVIRRSALLTIEGERDDICAIGQTMAAQDLASSPRSYLRTHCIQPNAGHYGVFSGKPWRTTSVRWCATCSTRRSSARTKRKRPGDFRADLRFRCVLLSALATASHEAHGAKTGEHQDIGFRFRDGGVRNPGHPVRRGRLRIGQRVCGHGNHAEDG